MPLEIRERDLPGVGRRYEIDLTEEQSLAVITHKNGNREIFLRDAGETDDYEGVFDLTDSQARVLGLLLVGAYYQPIATKLGDQSASGAYVDWYSVEASSPVVGESRAEAAFEGEFDATLLGVERDGEVRSTVPDEFVFRPGDQLIVIGSNGAHRDLSAYFYDR